SPTGRRAVRPPRPGRRRSRTRRLSRSERLLAGLDLLPPGRAVAVRRLHDVELERAQLALAAGEVDGAQRVLLELVAGEEHAGELVPGAVLDAVVEDLREIAERQPHLPVGVGD